ncbi:septal ring lytic transglycosylase RlpA family protein [Streptomyces sp. NPDC096538]|uniref:septal ring lytic transglycosylase RlpA family protein n=1 Tax=unclassified Streptomyces TaxID=2593676 RepID=UPI002096725F|nr:MULTISPECIES: septal ring lytic transglycosylase RlpA family protein [unclassified Streptomyces]MCO4700270.1 septal ring lytic transglycosylase RlpA family protein [Streptomyces sp. RO-S4]MDU0298779.1 septal ring lytic transglycosylase RlpA family protein [Streptomyces sp. PAL114]
MSRRRSLGPKKKLALLLSAATVAGGGAFVMATTSNASPPSATTKSAADSTVCQGLATALGNNQRFIAGQRADPDAQSEARIANREAVIAQIQLQQEASGCTVGESAQDSRPAQPEQPAPSQPAAGGQDGQDGQQGQDGQAGQEGQNGGGAAAGEQVCNGSTVTLSGEAGAPAASSNQFPAGTKLKVTNLDNAKSTTVEVTSVSGSCVLLNDAAFEQVREPGKFLIRRALIEKVG